ncbi:MAG: acetolactate decarboxylase [Candidatus Methanomethylicus sp.]|nr:acetolactate decarboxylase [Candidatus Methanomethylicus sp.]
MPSRNALVFIGISVIILVSCAAIYAYWQLSANAAMPAESGETLFQVAMFNVFSMGNFDGFFTFGELAKHGDFGIGTFDGLDGEMVALNGVFYQVPYSGQVLTANYSMKTPYATVTFFEPDQTIHIAGPVNYAELQMRIDESLPSDSAIYAVKVSGTFGYAKTRSVPAQTEPYPTLAEVVKNQSTFTFANISATAVGFWFPRSMEGVDYVGFHLHLVTDDHLGGGHLLECIVSNVTVELDQTNRYTLVLP